MYFVDCCVRVGRSPTADVPHLPLREIEQLYAKHGIARGLAYHVLAWEYDPVRGNEALLDVIEGHAAFSPLPAVSLNHDPRSDPVAAQLDRIGPKAVIAFPKQHGYVFERWVVGPWLKRLRRQQIALMVDVNEAGLPELVRTLRSFPELRVVLLGTRYHDYAMLHNAMRALPDLWVDLSRHHVFDGVRRLASPYGARRLVFGSGLPEFSPGSPKYQVLRSGLSREDMQRVCHGNLEELLGLAPSPDMPGANADLPCPLVDVHAHAGRWPRYGITDGPSDWLIDHAERTGVAAAVLANVFEGDRRAGNDRIAEVVSCRPGRWYAYASVSPSDGEAAVRAELERCHQHGAFRGIKVYPPHDKLALSDRRYDPIFGFANEHGWAVLFHGCPDRVADVAARFANAKFILGHSAGEPNAMELAEELPNVFTEICASTRARAQWHLGLNAQSAHKVLFGSDLPLLDPAAMAGAVMDVVDAPVRLRAILMENGCRLLGLETAAIEA